MNNLEYITYDEFKEKKEIRGLNSVSIGRVIILDVSHVLIEADEYGYMTVYIYTNNSSAVYSAFVSIREEYDKIYYCLEENRLYLNVD